MKCILCSGLIVLLLTTATAQQTRVFTDQQAALNYAKELYQKEYYSLAYPLFRDLNMNLRETDRSSQSLNYQEIRYYTLVCALNKMKPHPLELPGNL